VCLLVVLDAFACRFQIFGGLPRIKMCLARLRVHTSPFNQVLDFISSTAFVFDAFDLQDRILTVDLIGRVEHRSIRAIPKLFHEGIKSDCISL
jgi:hypothetical protein